MARKGIFQIQIPSSEDSWSFDPDQSNSNLSDSFQNLSQLAVNQSDAKKRTTGARFSLDKPPLQYSPDASSPGSIGPSPGNSNNSFGNDGMVTWPHGPKKHVRESVRVRSKRVRCSPQVSPVEPVSSAYHVLQARMARRDSINSLPLLSVEMPSKYKRRGQMRRGSVSAESSNSLFSQQFPLAPKIQDTNTLDHKLSVALASGELQRNRQGVNVDISKLYNILRNSFIFGSLEDRQKEIAFRSMIPINVNKNDVIIRQGVAGDFFYIIEAGKFEVFIGSGAFREKVGQYDGIGSFGELALMYACPRNATVVAVSAGKLWAIDRSSFQQIVVVEKMKERQQIESIMLTIPLLQRLPENPRSILADMLKICTFNNGDYVIRQRDMSNRFYIIVKGEALVTQNQPPDNRENILTVLGRGQFFGEFGILNNCARTANVLAQSSLQCLSVNRDEFLALFASDAVCQNTFREVATKYRLPQF